MSDNQTVPSATAVVRRRYCCDYWVVETTTPAGHDTAAPQQAVVGAGGTVTLTFTDPRDFKVIVLVCKEASNSPYASTVTVDGEDKTSWQQHRPASPPPNSADWVARPTMTRATATIRQTSTSPSNPIHENRNGSLTPATN